MAPAFDTTSAVPASDGAEAVHPAAPARAVVVCDQWLGSNGYAGMKALRRAGWSVQVVPEWEYVPTRWRGRAMRAAGRLLRPLVVRELGRALIDQTRRTEPELLLVFKGTFVHADALARLRQMGIRLYCFYPDVSFRTHGPYIPRALPLYDWVFTTKSFGLSDLREQLGITRASVVHHAFDPDLHRTIQLTPADLARYGCDLSFVGTWSPKKERILSELHARRPHLRLRVWGAQWREAGRRSSGLHDTIEGRALEGEEYVRAIAASTINLALLSERRLGASCGDQITSRSFHIPASGGFMLHERTSEILQVLREDEEVVCFAAVDELVSQIDRFIGDEAKRRTIAGRGQQRIRASHSWDHRIREILQKHVEFLA